MPLVLPLGRELWEVRSGLPRGPDGAGSVLCRAGTHDATAWVHQENPEDSAARYRPGAETEKRGRRMNKRNIGSSFDGWLREEGIYEEVTATAVKRVLARQVEAAMK